MSVKFIQTERNIVQKKLASEEPMKSKGCILLLMLAILTNSPNLMPKVNAQGAGDAYFTEVEYPKSKIYQADASAWRFTIELTVHNVNCSADIWGRAWFFFIIYKDGELSWNEYNDTTYKTWQCNKSTQVRARIAASIPTWSGPKTYNYKIELYWDYEGTPYLQDTTSFTITLALFIPPRESGCITTWSYLSFYSFVTIVLILYLLTTGPLKTRSIEKQKTTKSTSDTCLTPANMAL